jgi:Bacterial Ig domain
MKLARTATLAVALTGLLVPTAATSTASAQGPTAGASAKRAASACAKRAPRSSATWRRCVANFRASTSKTRDTTAPSVSWKAPLSGVTVKGGIQGSACEALASDNRGVSRVVMKVDGTTLNTESDAPWNCAFDSTKVSDGSHTLSATAYDAAGNSRTASVSINVANKASAPQAPAPAPAPEPVPEPIPTPGDTTPPTVSWKAPTAGATVKGKIQGSACEALASDASAIEKVVMKVDGATLNTESDAPWNCAFDSTKVADGSHTITASAYDAFGNARTASVTVTVANAPAPAPEPAPEPAPAPEPSPAPAPAPGAGSLVVAIDGGHGTWTSTEVSHRTQLGAAVTRHEWDITEPVNWQDALVLKAVQANSRIHALIGGNELGPGAAYRDFVVAFVRRYGLGGSFWDLHPEIDEARFAITTVELGNEPYFDVSAASYSDSIRPALEAIKAQALPVKVVLAQRIYGSDTSWMDTLYARIPNLNSLFYAFAEHPYWYAHDPAQVAAAGPFGRIDKVRQRMNEKGAADKPIFLTEYGESTALCATECVSEAVQDEHLRKMLNAVVTRDYWKVEMISVFQLLDRGTNSTDREQGFGILRQNGTQKPVYSFVRGLMQTYRG